MARLTTPAPHDGPSAAVPDLGFRHFCAALVQDQFVWRPGITFAGGIELPRGDIRPSVAALAPPSVPVARGALRFPLELDTRYRIPVDYEAIAWQSVTRPDAARR